MKKVIKHKNNISETKVKIDAATKELKDQIKKLRKISNAKSEFISIVAHQLRAPLTVIKGYLSMLHEGSLGKLTAQQKDAISKTYHSNSELIELVENLLYFSRIEDGRIRYNYTEINLGQIVKSIVNQFELQLTDKHLKIDINQPKDLPKIKGDFNKLKNVVANLLDNAIKYTDQDGSIDIKLSADKQKVVFEITDSGMGMVPNDAQHLFEKFYRNDEMSVIHIQGSGLGLYIIQRFIVAHGGQIWASSPGRGQGSAFGFSLPRLICRADSVDI